MRFPISERSRRMLVLFGLAFSSGPARALPERPMSIGFGFGLPDLVAATADIVALPPRWQIGFGFGIDGGFAGGLLPVNRLLSEASQTRSITLFDGREYQLTPEADPASVNMMLPYLRFYPTQSNFYLQLTWALLRMSTHFTSTIRDVGTGTNIAALLTGDIAFVQQVPTFSIGNVFHSKAFFVNVRLGVSILFTTSCHVSLSASLPDSVGGLDSNKEALGTVQTQLSDAVVNAAQQAKDQVFVIPSIAVSTGVIF